MIILLSALDAIKAVHAPFEVVEAPVVNLSSSRRISKTAINPGGDSHDEKYAIIPTSNSCLQLSSCPLT